MLPASFAGGACYPGCAAATQADLPIYMLWPAGFGVERMTQRT